MEHKFEITREIGIDAAHRVLLHGSKCRNLHGHRYTIQVTVSGDLASEGEETGMVMDFSFLKDEMMFFIDEACDHAAIVWIKDHELLFALLDEANRVDRTMLIAKVTKRGGMSVHGKFGKLYVTNFIPTAENLAKHWYDLLGHIISERTLHRAAIQRVRVWETPNCFCDYPAK